MLPDLVAQSRSPLFRSYGCILPSSFNIILPSALVFSTCPPVSVSGTVLMMELFPGTISLQTQSDKCLQFTSSVTTIRSRNINRVPIDYCFRTYLRGRLTLRGLTLRRNPWAFGECFSHSLSLLMSAFSLLIPPITLTCYLQRLTERSATMPYGIHSFGVWL